MIGKTPDWKELGRIADRAESLKKSGSLDYDQWRALVAEADSACHGDEQFTEIMCNSAQPEWVERLLAEPRPKKRRAA